MENHGTITAIVESTPKIDNIKNSILESINGGVIIPEATKKGFTVAFDGDGVYVNRPHQKRGVVQTGMIQTIKTSCDDIGVVVKDNKWTPTQTKMITEDGNVKRYIQSDVVDEFNEGDCADISFPNGYNKANRVFKGYAPTLYVTTTQANFITKSNLRIRKLTPRECGRLMGVSEKDITIMSKNQSNSSLYHLFGDSIVINVLMAIFREML